MFFMGLVPLLVLVLIVWLIVEPTRRHEDRPAPPAWAPPPSWPDARALLDERYARGEIERQEYLQRREDLSR
jgi:putative membrane protein